MTAPLAFFQASWVVRDMEAAIRRWQQTSGVGPFFVNPNPVVREGRYRGLASAPSYTIALAQSGPMQIELIAQHDDLPSVYRDIGDPGPAGTFHHMAYFTDDAEGEFARYAAMGAPLLFDGWFGDMRLGYVDTRATLGFMVEVLAHDPVVEGVFARIAEAAVGWDGRDPVRPFPA